MNCHEYEPTGLAVVVACVSDASLHLAVQQATGSELAMLEASVAVVLSFHKADQKCIEHKRKRFYYQFSLLVPQKKKLLLLCGSVVQYSCFLFPAFQITGFQIPMTSLLHKCPW